MNELQAAIDKLSADVATLINSSATPAQLATATAAVNALDLIVQQANGTAPAPPAPAPVA